MSREARHEEHRVGVRALRRIGMAVAAGLVIVLVAMYALWRQLPQPPAERRMAFAGARLQAHAPAEREEALARQRKRLTQYRWTDATHRYAQVPIERAMDIVAGEAHSTPKVQP